jgi:hypothetical protein
LRMSRVWMVSGSLAMLVMSFLLRVVWLRG